MADLDDIYNQKIFDLAAETPPAERLEAPDATATAHSKLCGSTITVDLKLKDDRITDFAQTVKACLLGQASASIVAREVVGTTTDEIREIGREMRAMLKEGGPPPNGKWADLALLESVKDYPHRHTSTLLVFEAIERALESAGAKSS